MTSEIEQTAASRPLPGEFHALVGESGRDLRLQGGRQVPAEVGEVEQRRTAHGELPIQHGGDFAVFGEQIRRIEIPVDQHRRFGFGAGKAAEPGDPVVSQPPLNGGVGVHDFVELPEWPRFHSAIREEAAGFGKTEPAEPAEYSPR